MELREYLAIRRAYNIVRQGLDSTSRLTFAELAILARMEVLGRPMNTSEIAEYQGALRPTMTHRTKHLADLGMISRSKGSADRRNVLCEITETGREHVRETSTLICDILHAGKVLSRTVPRRVCSYIDAMGAISCMSGELVLLGISRFEERRCSVGDLVSLLGLLQPTVSMSVSALEKTGLVKRDGSSGKRSVDVVLTDEGAARAVELEDQIRMIIVHRK